MFFCFLFVINTLSGGSTCLQTSTKEQDIKPEYDPVTRYTFLNGCTEEPWYDSAVKTYEGIHKVLYFHASNCQNHVLKVHLTVAPKLSHKDYPEFKKPRRFKFYPERNQIIWDEEEPEMTNEYFQTPRQTEHREKRAEIFKNFLNGKYKLATAISRKEITEKIEIINKKFETAEFQFKLVPFVHGELNCQTSLLILEDNLGIERGSVKEYMPVRDLFFSVVIPNRFRNQHIKPVGNQIAQYMVKCDELPALRREEENEKEIGQYMATRAEDKTDTCMISYMEMDNYLRDAGSR